MHQVIQPSDVCALFYVDLAHKQIIFVVYFLVFPRVFIKTLTFKTFLLDTMETNVSTEKTESVSPLIKHVNDDTCLENTTPTPPEDRCGTADVAKARWTLLRQVTFA